MINNSLTYTERVTYTLRELYESYGYTQYKMSKFEEYDLYVKNKSFLLSDHIIAFTDTDGKLMALKPDVTLSIVKNSTDRESGVSRVYYNENVYRVPRGGFSFKEIIQSGLECIGELDTYTICEVLSLAAKSLYEISEDFVLDISHLGIISAVIDKTGVGGESRDRLISAVGEKNLHEIDRICKEADPKYTGMLKELVSMRGDGSELLEILKGSDIYKEAEEFSYITEILKDSFKDRIRIDFSVIDDMRYYNGIVFKGFVKGIPTSVLSGGRYDKLMERMKKKSSAIGFALYLDTLDGFEAESEEFDGDVFVMYDENTPLSLIIKTADELVKSGKRVQCGREMSEKLKFKELVKI